MLCIRFRGASWQASINEKHLVVEVRSNFHIDQNILVRHVTIMRDSLNRIRIP
jgi:hypothetical protein